MDAHVTANLHILHPPTLLIIYWKIQRYRYIVYRIFKAGGEQTKSQETQTHS